MLTDIRVELPQLRPGPPPRRLEVEGDGIEVLSADLQGTSGSDTVWNVRLRATAEPGCRADRAPGRVRATEVGRGRSAAHGRAGPGTVRLPVGRGRRGRAPGGRDRGGHASRRPPKSLIASRVVLFQQFVDDDLGCASYLVGDEEAGVAAIVDPPFAIEPVLAEAARRDVRIVRTIETHTHADHLSGHGRLALEHAAADLDPPRRRGGVRTRSARGRHRDRARRGRAARDPHARTPSGAHLPRRDRPLARRRAVARPDRRLALRRRCGPPRSRGRRAGGRGGALSLAAALLELPDGVEVFPGPRRRLALRQGDELEGLLDDRLRTPLQRRAPDRARSPTSSPTRPRCRRPSRRT